MEPVLGIVAVGYRAVGGGLGGTVAVCVVGVHLRPENLGCGQKAAAVPHPYKKPGQFGVLAGGQVAVGKPADSLLPVQSVLPRLLLLQVPQLLGFRVLYLGKLPRQVVLVPRHRPGVAHRGAAAAQAVLVLREPLGGGLVRGLNIEVNIVLQS